VIHAALAEVVPLLYWSLKNDGVPAFAETPFF
jgi:hypothetical protein